MMLQTSVRDFLLQYDVLDETDNSVRIAVEIASIAAKEGSVFLCSCLAVLIRENRRLKKEVNGLIAFISNKEYSNSKKFSDIVNSKATKPKNSGKPQLWDRNVNAIDSLSSSYNVTSITLPHKGHNDSSTSSGYSTASKENEQSISRKFPSWNKNYLMKATSSPTSDRKRLRGSRRSYRKTLHTSSDSNYLSEFSQENSLVTNSSLNCNLNVQTNNLKENLKQFSSHEFPPQKETSFQSNSQISTLAEVSPAPLNAESFPSEKSSCYSEEELDTIYAPYPLAGCGCDVCLDMVKDPHQTLFHLDSDGSSILKPGNKVVVLSSEIIYPKIATKVDMEKKPAIFKNVSSDENKTNSELAGTDSTSYINSPNFESHYAYSGDYFPNGCQTDNEREASTWSLSSDATYRQKQFAVTVLYCGHRRRIDSHQSENLEPTSVGVVALYPDGSEHFVSLNDVLFTLDDEYPIPQSELHCHGETDAEKVYAQTKPDPSLEFEKNADSVDSVTEAFNLEVCSQPFSDEEGRRQRCQSESVLNVPDNVCQSNVSLRRSESVSINIYSSDDNSQNLEEAFNNDTEVQSSEFSMSKFLNMYIGRKSDGFGNCPVFV